MKYCAKCGAELSENSKFCEKCGNKVNVDFPDNRNKSNRAGKIVAVVVVAAIIAVAVYLQYTKIQKDNDLVKEASIDVNERTYEISNEDMYSEDDIFADKEDNRESQTGKENAQANGEGVENPGEAVLSSTNVDSLDFAVKVKLNREQIRSQNKSSLFEIINNTEIGEEQKQDAINAMIAMTDIAEREAAAEMLLEAKGFTDVVVSITDNNADVVLNMGEVTDAKRAQVEDIVKRKTNVAAENIVITPIQKQTEAEDSTEENESATETAADSIGAEDDNVKYIDGAYTSSIQLDDTAKIILNTKGTMDDVTPELKMPFDFIDGKAPEDEFTRELDEAVQSARKNEKWRALNVQWMFA